MNSKTLSAKRIIMATAFTIYCLTLFYFLFISGHYGRHFLTFEEPYLIALKKYIDTSFNLNPFSTILLYIRAYKLSAVSNSVLTINLLGNFIAFMPFSVFIPYFFKKFRIWYKFLLFIIITVICVEVLQLVFMTGVCDIDDLILNTLGAIIIYFVYMSLRKRSN